MSAMLDDPREIGAPLPQAIEAEQNVIGGPGAFTMPVNDWSQFPEAIRRKLAGATKVSPPTGAGTQCPKYPSGRCIASL